MQIHTHNGQAVLVHTMKNMQSKFFNSKLAKKGIKSVLGSRAKVCQGLKRSMKRSLHFCAAHTPQSNCNRREHNLNHPAIYKILLSSSAHGPHSPLGNGKTRYDRQAFRHSCSTEALDTYFKSLASTEVNPLQPIMTIELSEGRLHSAMTQPGSDAAAASTREECGEQALRTKLKLNDPVKREALKMQTNPLFSISVAKDAEDPMLAEFAHLQLLKAETQSFLEQVQREAAAATKWNSEAHVLEVDISPTWLDMLLNVFLSHT
eukprot:1145922-Pelagomonas_calceolata.AAC.6